MPPRERTPAEIAAFAERVLAEGRARYRDLPWRRTRDPYAILVSEVMLQQTQVARVVPRYERWLDRFPTLDALSAASLADVLDEWQGLGYNRRAVSLKRTAEECASRFAGDLPRSEAELRSLPGIGPATAAGIRAFALDEPSLYLETNVRSAAIHELFGDESAVRDAELEPLLRDALAAAMAQGATPHEWYYALLDYGAWLKRAFPNPSRRSAHHTRQSRFEGSRRQKRARLLRAVMSAPGLSAGDYAEMLAPHEAEAGRSPLTAGEASELLSALADEGFLAREGGGADASWRVAQ